MNKKILLLTIIIMCNVSWINAMNNQDHIPFIGLSNIPPLPKNWWEKFNIINTYYAINTLLAAHQVIDMQQRNGSFTEKSKYIGNQIFINSGIQIGTGLIVAATKGIVTIIKDTYTRHRDRNKIEPLKNTLAVLETTCAKIADERNQLSELLREAIKTDPTLLQKLSKAQNKNGSSNTTTSMPSIQPTAATVAPAA